MSQDIRRECAGVRFETIAGATHYIARLEKALAEIGIVANDLYWASEPHSEAQMIANKIEAIVEWANP